MSDAAQIGPKGVTSRVATFFLNYWPYLLQTVGQVGLVLAGFFIGQREDLSSNSLALVLSWPGAVLGVLAAMWVVGFGFVIRRADQISNLRNRASVLTEQLETIRNQRDSVVSDYFSIIERCLRILANDFLEFDDTERISIYQHNGRAFLMLGRYSKHPDYRRRGRSVYPDDQGCIGRAWRNGSAFAPCLPDPGADINEYIKANKEDWNLPAETTYALVMKSRTIAAFAVEDAHGDRIAVIVFESTNVNRLDYSTLYTKVRAEPEGRFLASIIEDMKPYEPTPSMASRKGF